MPSGSPRKSIGLESTSWRWRLAIPSVRGMDGKFRDRCDFLDVLEEAVIRHARVRVATKDDRLFIDRVFDVVTENGADYVVFAEQGRMPVDSIRRLVAADAP